ncbi:MAG: hypothetical protein JRI83_06135 [Deltaproteobacteria bacterium]|nr:hypothetical protein [Deltaproteobacteria bacterium]
MKTCAAFRLILICTFPIFVSVQAVARPPVPEIVSPSDGETLVTLTPALKWKPSENARRYEVRLVKIHGAQEAEVSLQKDPLCDSARCILQLECGTLEQNTPYKWQVRAVDGAGETSPWAEAGFDTPSLCDPEEDQDCDGIPNDVEEEKFRTDKSKKTLFVKPVRKTGQQEEYWAAFYTDLFPQSQGGLAVIPGLTDVPFENACSMAEGIEVVVIGAPDRPGDPNNHPLMKGARGFLYLPKDHPEWPCTIMEVVLKEDKSDYPQKLGHGHIYFSGGIWKWSTKGKTVSEGADSRYGKPVMYQYSLDRYFTEGAYDCIQTGETPFTVNCSEEPEKCRKRSPLNWVDNDPFSCENCSEGTSTPCVDETVEFNVISFQDDGEIKKVEERGKPYEKNEVLVRTIVHEMGHALSHSEHCFNPCCIMNANTKDWEPRRFGQCLPDDAQSGGFCEHSPGSAWDIRSDGVIYNKPAGYK